MSIESFISPKFNYPLLWLTDITLPVLLKSIYNIDKIIISEEDKKKLKFFSKERLIYVSNHPTIKEPSVAYYVANTMETRFHYIAAREIFTWGAGFVGNLIQNLGAFSVLAGTVDIESLKTARAVLASQGGKLVLFPEGEPTGGENDNLLPFQPDVAQLGFWGLEDARNNDPNADILILPSFTKYRMSDSKELIQNDVDRSLETMENKLGIGKKGKDIVHRLLSIGKKLIEKAEKEFGVIPKENQTFDYRIGQLRHVILNDIAAKIEIKNWDINDHAINKLKKILNTIEMVFVGMPDPNYELPSMDAAKWAKLACRRAYDFITIKTDYLTSFPTAERIYEWIYRFENELMGKTVSRASNVYVRFANTFRISDFYEEYKKNGKVTIDKITNKLKEEIQSLLDEEVKKSELLFPKEQIF